MIQLSLFVRLARLNRPCFLVSPLSSSPVFGFPPVSLVSSRVSGASPFVVSIRCVHVDALGVIRNLQGIHVLLSRVPTLELRKSSRLLGAIGFVCMSMSPSGPVCLCLGF